MLVRWKGRRCGKRALAFWRPAHVGGRMSAVGRSWSMFLVPFWAAFEKISFFFAIFSQPSLLSFRKCSVSSPSDGKTAPTMTQQRFWGLYIIIESPTSEISSWSVLTFSCARCAIAEAFKEVFLMPGECSSNGRRVLGEFLGCWIRQCWLAQLR